MRARARVEVGLDGGRNLFRVLRSDPPLLLRPTPTGLMLVGGAAGPLGGDDLELDLVVDAGASLTVRSAAASMALPGRRPSRLDIRAKVGDDACLIFEPEPLVSVVGSDHRQRSRIELGARSHLRWRETTVLGRTGEDPGQLLLGLRAERAGVPVLDQALHLGPPGCRPDYRSPAVLGGARVMVSELTIGSEQPDDPAAVVPVADVLERSMSVPLASGVRLTTALGQGVGHATARLTDITARAGGVCRSA